MARSPLHFRQRDVTAAVKAVENAGKKVSKVGLDKDGNITIYVGVANSNSGDSRKPTQWDIYNAEQLQKRPVHQKLRE